MSHIVAQRYEILRHVGKGGMQDVFLAKDHLLQCEVALKTPQAGQVLRRFSQSAIIAAKVNHHNVAKTLDYFEDEGKAYLIEEYVPGRTLEKVIEEFGAVDPHLGARVFLHLAKGVAASHYVDVIHRDLKPSNIIVGPGVNLHQLKITDFGIATFTKEVLDEAAKDGGDLTNSTSGTIKGALPYMAPEMMFRSPGDHPGKSTDIWSLGALMFRVLTGDYPFGVYLEAAVNVKTGQRAAWPGFMTSNPQYKILSEQLQLIVESCLQSDLKARPTAGELVRSLSDLCFICGDRYEGELLNLIQNGYSGFVMGGDGLQSFFSMESIYGLQKPSNERRRVCYSRFPGSPHFRGHPMVVMR
ncbi:serine/threonine-protein kinase [Pseudomonas mosselii]|uniref:serine/threonine-protein kinase n=1 Tax=Pseudomonas mosselii TaxID=78327 RepID=UPI000D815E14|nr:serine/threonine-protein kinase [Pseudomonas mosselii]PYC22808.1 serine/threonine protein kinase [Pseudomonas mosselii]